MFRVKKQDCGLWTLMSRGWLKGKLTFTECYLISRGKTLREGGVPKESIKTVRVWRVEKSLVAWH